MIRGSCLCGSVRFEFERATGPLELCHCNRCQKASGSAFVAGVGVPASGFRWISGRDSVTTYDAPILYRAPAYRTAFCKHCGAPTPDPEATDRTGGFEIAAGTLDDDPGLKPDRHIFVEHRAPWHDITDDLPQLDRAALIELRARGQSRKHRDDE